jgi:hypothetical protein
MRRKIHRGIRARECAFVVRHRARVTALVLVLAEALDVSQSGFAA